MDHSHRNAFCFGRQEKQNITPYNYYKHTTSIILNFIQKTFLENKKTSEKSEIKCYKVRMIYLPTQLLVDIGVDAFPHSNHQYLTLKALFRMLQMTRKAVGRKWTKCPIIQIHILQNRIFFISLARVKYKILLESQFLRWVKGIKIYRQQERQDTYKDMIGIWYNV